MASITLDRVSKRYPNGFQAVHDLSIDIADGEFMVLVGPSGCGKTTALRMVAGLEDISSGTLSIGGRVVNEVTPRERDVAMVFQNYALYPHMTVADNIGFSLKLRKLSKSETKEKVRAAADVLGLTEWLDRKPAQLSGGQRQRVAMGRAIVRDPRVFLMDEPLSNLDAKLRVEMRAEVARIQRRIGVAAIYVTHDQTEAMTMGDRVAVLGGGRLQQCDQPQVLYDRPANLFVAAFIGSPAMNLYRAALGQGSASVHVGSQSISLPESLRRGRPGLVRYAGRPVVVGIRAEDLHLGGPPQAAEVWDGCLEGRVELIESLGSEMLVHFSFDAERADLKDVGVADGEAAEEGWVGASDTGIARAEPRAAVTIGQMVRFGVDPDRLHFFDAGTGEAIV
ncbi:sn-glycerol-3-phosphate ABC transporter ATP-binding protein UgpC [Acidiferrimicrobium sp. IK]|uniref:ABC transporter ATP-binding protein n=1 Tax=Acidiferrimicrobium sp. IK TaxID=2871700 RepID=UPI0021CB71EE|nr:sn-glycerol-3-phosphate ABC transporter ATP-binding protein UgpC [Acidiferrimicrobium sp. IK]MCU4185370.1 sn-glycerol-3-phosphate ABC transporter ATP-binding protein UgpC [Acidiferrimicrobium sp. IK]